MYQEDTSPAFTYGLSLYYSVLYLGINEIGPVTINEMIVCIALLIISILVMTAQLSDVAVLF